MIVTIRDSCPEDALLLRENLRPFEATVEDRLGMEIISEKNIQEASWAKSAFRDDAIAVIVGVKMDSLIGRRGHLWLVSTRESVDWPTVFGRYSVKILRDLRRRFDSLHGVACHEFPESIRWLRWLGFHLAPAHSANGLSFSQFWWSR